MKRSYDTTLARIAGNIAPALLTIYSDRKFSDDMIAAEAVTLARRIVQHSTTPPTKSETDAS